jgi:deoxycytidylate deaminase
MILNVAKYTNSKLDESIEKLKKLATNSPIQYRHGACLLKGNKIYSVGINRYIKEIILNNKLIKFTVHAEMDALYKYDGKNIKGMDILIIRIGKLGDSSKLRNSRPCNSCIEKMAQRGIRKVYYSNEDGDIVYEFIDSMPKIHVSSGYMARDRVTLFNNV